MAGLGVVPCLMLAMRKAQSAGFWQAAWLTSTFFGYIHTFNKGETWIGILYPPGEDPDGPGQWLAFSRDEIKKKGQQVSVVMPQGGEYELTGDDTLFRVWIPHPRIAKEADSPVRAAMDDLREIVRTTRKIRNADNSRLKPALLCATR